LKKTEHSNVTISNVERIGNSAFYYCKNLINITIPESVKKIDDYAFNSCWYSNKGTVELKRKSDFEYSDSMFWSGFNVSIAIPIDARDNYINDDGNIIFKHVKNDNVSFY